MAAADTGKLTAAAMRALACIWRPGFSYKKAGVVFPALTPAAQVQGDLFGHSDTAASQRLMQTLDRLNRRYGRGTVTYGTAGRDQAWKLRRDYASARYTTSWQELLEV